MFYSSSSSYSTYTTTNPRQPYTYTPLSGPHSIRLLQRQGLTPDGLISVTLKEIDLAEQPIPSPYHANHPNYKVTGKEWPAFHCLSYTWGNPFANGTPFKEHFQAREAEYSDGELFDIVCDDKILKIRKNLLKFFEQAPTDRYAEIRTRVNNENGKIMLHDDATRSPAILHQHVAEGDPVDAQDNLGSTTLHYAAAAGRFENVRILLKGGASIDVKDSQGFTAEDRAKQHGHARVATVLEACRKYGSEWITYDVPEFVHQRPDKYIWIDSICIDQSNLEERAQQVKIMDGIYLDASYTIIWLGTTDEHTDRAISTISKLTSHANEFAESDLIPFRAQKLHDYALVGMPYISQAEWDSLAALFLRQWFRRVWALQEAIFSKGLLVYCGDKRIDWDGLELAAHTINARSQKLGYAPSTIYIPLNEIATSVEYHFLLINHARRARQKMWQIAPEQHSEDLRGGFRWKQLLLGFFPFLSTDPRDKIYALINLCMLSTLGVAEKHRFSADYTISTVECFTRFMKFVLTDVGDVGLLSFVQDTSTKKIEGLPSWVPDFSLSGTSPLLLHWFAVSSDIKLDADLPAQLNDSQLHIQAMRLDEIVAVAAPRPPGGPLGKNVLDKSWFELIRTLPRPDPNHNPPQSRGEILWRTLCCDTDSTTFSSASSDFGPMFKQFICALLCSEPEHSARKDGPSESSVQLLGLMSTVARMREEANPRPGRHGPDEEAMARYRAEVNAKNRKINGKHFASSRPALAVLTTLVSDGDEPYLPTAFEVQRYFTSGARPLTFPDGSIAIPPGTAPFVNSYHAVYGGRRLFRTKSGRLGLGPLSLDVGDTIWMLPGLNLPVILSSGGCNNNESSTPWQYREMRTMRFVGTSYVNGVMRERFAEHFSAEKLEDIVLV